MKKVFTIVFLAIGITLILIGYDQKTKKISNFNDNDTNITIVDLSQSKKDYFNYYLISGMSLISIGLILLLDFIAKPNKKKELNPLENLTNQEIKVFHFITEGKSSKQIAVELSLSISTIKTHTNNIFKKLDVNSRKQLINFQKK